MLSPKEDVTLNLSDRIDSVLMQVQKPVRYMGGEFGSVMKDPADISVRYAFLFPDVYEVGMSHLGMKILYHAMNLREDTWCERVFTPWVDMEQQMREHQLPLFSLESRTPISEFDLLGITLQYEMSYTNILTSLDLAGIPLRQKDRTDGPFVICGGPCAYNAEPIADFVDLIVLGDGEQITLDLLDVYKDWRSSGAAREEFLKMAVKLQGVYAPSLYDVTYHTDGTIESVLPKRNSGAPERVYKALVNDLNGADFPDQLIVPYGEVVHNRIMLEIFRGCTRGCRFCQAGMIYRPVRERSVERLMGLAETLVHNTGYDEISLMSLSSGDYSCLPELAGDMITKFIDKRVKVSLPSMRIDSVIKDTLAQTQKVRKTALTLAPEAGSQRLRDVINKGVTEEDLIRSVHDAFEQGWSSVKLYFMIGLPTETDEDVMGIVDLASKVQRQYFSIPKSQRAPGLRITVSASVFVPKPFTPFQWSPQLDRETIVHRQGMLKHELSRIKGVDFKYHAPDLSFTEAVFATGDRRLGDVLELAWSLGCRFEGWSEQFRYDLWMQAFRELDVDPCFYACRTRDTDETLPWDHLDAGIDKEFLLREWDRAQQALITPDCRKGCANCGMKRYEGACL
ncbi:TIGR03960 family B12-binding radical SAM protein [Eubacteriales bacterium OttesenSCG-928-N13]|nr:TIGR03960 family B12-binding radical SAM protein [Eubacteriales bacterium OttesenSCG-928-N13]